MFALPYRLMSVLGSGKGPIVYYVLDFEGGGGGNFFKRALFEGGKILRHTKGTN